MDDVSDSCKVACKRDFRSVAYEFTVQVESFVRSAVCCMAVACRVACRVVVYVAACCRRLSYKSGAQKSVKQERPVSHKSVRVCYKSVAQACPTCV